jgi:hypothetical protein
MIPAAVSCLCALEEQLFHKAPALHDFTFSAVPIKTNSVLGDSDFTPFGLGSLSRGCSYACRREASDFSWHGMGITRQPRSLPRSGGRDLGMFAATNRLRWNASLA